MPEKWKQECWFRGTRKDGKCKVTVDGRSLPKRLDLRRHSPTGFEWGYCGSGPAQLALAICCKVAGDEVGQQVYQEYKRQFIASIDGNEWAVPWFTVERWIGLILAKIKNHRDWDPEYAIEPDAIIENLFAEDDPL